MTQNRSAAEMPGLPPAVCDQLAQDLYCACRDRIYIPPITETHPECDVASAYAIARAVNALKIESGLVVKGHKIGLTSQAMRDLAGSDAPDFGTLFDNMFIPEGSSVSLSQFNRGVGVEIEIAFVLGKSLRGPHVSAADVLRATDYIRPAIEIVDKRYTRPGPGPVLIDSVADGAWCGGVVLGSICKGLTQIDSRSIGGELTVNGEMRARGVSSGVMGDPVLAVAWLANKLAEFGEGLEAGHTVMSGSFTTLISIRSESSIMASFGTLGDVQVQVTQ